MKSVLVLPMLLFLFSCGVKGKPSPPLDPAFIGNGRPLQDPENLKKNSGEKEKK